MIEVRMSLEDAARTVDALLEAADACETSNPSLCRRYRKIADEFGTELDRKVPVPSGHVANSRRTQR